MKMNMYTIMTAVLASFLFLAAAVSASAYVEYASTQSDANDLYLGPFEQLPLTAIDPNGWLKTWLEDQRNGLTGHVEKAGFPFNTCMWAGPSIENEIKKGDWAAYEQTAFYLDGALRVGLLLDDEKLISRVREQIEYVLANPDPNGLLGPTHVKARWPRANFFRTMRIYYEATGDKRILDALLKHFEADTELVDKEEFGRASVMIETLIWAYELTGKKELLDHAIRMQEYFDKTKSDYACSTPSLLSDELPHVHGAMFAEMVHLPTLLYTATGEKRWLQASEKGYKKITNEHMLPDGVFSSEEGTNGKGPLNAHETCAIADYVYNTGTMLMATGNVHYADRVERACMNAAPSVVTNRFRAFQYFSAPNLLRATRWSSHIEAPDEKDPNVTHFCRGRFRYRPGHPVPCCTGSVHRLMPSYVSRMFLSDRKGGLVAALYGPAVVRAKVGKNNTPVTITERTHFPFTEKIDFIFDTNEPVEFTFTLRIPSWTKDPQLTLNNEKLCVPLVPGKFAKVTQTFKDGDILTLRLPMQIKKVDWPKNGIHLERGPLVYALQIKDERKAIEYPEFETPDPKIDPDFPQWDITPTSDWNYALAIDKENLKKDLIIFLNPITNRPWEKRPAAIELRVPAKKVPGWDYLKVKKEDLRKWPAQDKNEKRPDVFTFTPPLPDELKCEEKTETVKLIPYGCTTLRMTILPVCE